MPFLLSWALVFGLPDIAPLEPARHFDILSILGQHICMQKLLLALGGRTILYKTFPNFYIFHCKNDCLNPKFRLFGNLN